ncbi:Uu.00g138430.m01.CDS01 [Anthostomella pinea]|uniref:Uu.00g138430.m01.CDS01 n=1 Tax=Anthostomella pinea TaxID=933095 RepID=A0AAI8VQW7_9PEZI|nr:Uu.00g138430.m01.CDS01 [Anthostomella pinea]
MRNTRAAIVIVTLTIIITRIHLHISSSSRSTFSNSSIPSSSNINISFIRTTSARVEGVEVRGSSHERGRSAPPPINDSPWDARASTTATLFPHRSQALSDQPRAWKALPTTPGQFRLGEDGLPWSAWAWPSDPNGYEDESPFANNPTTVHLSPERRRRIEDPERVRELETLSTAMMTVDNGFENQWWFQGPRASTTRASDDGDNDNNDDDDNDDDDDARPLSAAEAMLLASAEPPATGGDTYDSGPPNPYDIVSPISDMSSPTPSFRGPLYRSLTTRSEELWIGS